MELIKIDNGFMLRVNEREAHKIIESLSKQFLSGSPNVGREEFLEKNHGYFSVALHETSKTT